MKKLHIIHLGIGNVGSELLKQMSKQEESLIKEFGTQLVYYGMFNATSGITNREETSATEASRMKSKFQPLESNAISGAIENVSKPFVVIDTSASDQTYPYLLAALKRGGYVIMSNKKPLSGSEKNFDQLHKVGEHRIFYETVVGAGLPVIQTLNSLIATGDEIIEVQGCFSGTLGYIFSELENGVSFSQAVLEAKKRGFTEPDPRDDLSGTDVARKALILARLLGKKLALNDINLESLYPPSMQELTSVEFIHQLPDLDEVYRTKLLQAQERQKVLRYVASVSKQQCNVGTQEVDATSDIGGLRGPDNLIVIKTKRYYSNPLVVKGPGAGIEVTAAGVFGDIVKILAQI